MYFRKILASDRNPPIDAVIAAGVIPHIVALLDRHDHPELQVEAAWAITNIACGSIEQVLVLLQHDVARKLIQLLHTSTNDAVREQTLWALGNMTIDPKHARVVLDAQILDPLLSFIGMHTCIRMSFAVYCIYSSIYFSIIIILHIFFFHVYIAIFIHIYIVVFKYC